METQESIGLWQTETFGGEGPEAGRETLRRMFEEVVELMWAAGVDQKLMYKMLYATTNKLYIKECGGEELQTPEKLAEEIADVAIMLMGGAHHLGVDIQNEVNQKMEINRARQWARRADGTFQHKE